MPFSIFYSWQTDLPDKIGRDLIRRAVGGATNRINAGLTVEEPLRVNEATKGIPGSPAIADTILEKIGRCGVFMPDVTFITDGPRRCPNPNVMIEYGYALSIVTAHRIIPVFNSAFGSCDDLPFDMAHRRWPLQYTCPIGADQETRKIARDRLSRDLEMALRVVIESGIATPPSIKQPPFAGAEPQEGPSSFVARGQPLGSADRVVGPGTSRELFLPNTAQMFLRFIPIRPHEPLLKAVEAGDLLTASDLRPMSLFRLRGGWSFGRGSDGAFCYAVDPAEPNIAWTLTQLFRSGELWAIDAFTLDPIRQRLPEDLPSTPELPVDILKCSFLECAEQFLRVSRDYLASGLPIRVVGGVTSVRGYKVVTRTQSGGHIIRDNVIREIELKSFEQPVEPILRPIFEAIYDEADMVMPSR